MKDIAELIGWIGIISFGIAILNYIIKFINKKYVSKIKINEENKKYIVLFRTLMKYVVKYHKYFGMLASIAIFVHFLIMYNTIGLSIIGIIAASLMWILFLIGVYGTYINKNLRGSWVKYHRFIAFVLIAFIILHLLTKRYFII